MGNLARLLQSFAVAAAQSAKNPGFGHMLQSITGDLLGYFDALKTDVTEAVDDSWLEAVESHPALSEHDKTEIRMKASLAMDSRLSKLPRI